MNIDTFKKLVSPDIKTLLKGRYTNMAIRVGMEYQDLINVINLRINDPQRLQQMILYIIEELQMIGDESVMHSDTLLEYCHKTDLSSSKVINAS